MTELKLIVKSINNTKRDFDVIKSDLRQIKDIAKTSTTGISSSFRDMGQGIKSSVDGMREITIGAFREIGRIGVSAFVEIAAAVGGYIKSSASAIVQTGKDFTESMASIRALIRPTTQELASLEEAARRMGSTTVFTSTEAANAIEMLGKNGLDTTQILAGALNSSLSLAASTGTGLSSSADIMTDAMSNFGIESAQTSDVVDTLAGVVVNSKFSMNDMRLALAQAGGVAGTAGVSFGDFSATMAGIAPLFASGSDAGTSFKTFLQRLVPQTDTALVKMKSLGIITEESGNRFFDATGNLRSMSEISGVLQTALSGLTDEQKTATLSILFGTDAMRAAVGVANLGTEGFGDLSDAISEVDAEGMASDRLDSLAGDTDRLNSATEGLALRLFDFVKNPLRQLIQGTINTVTKINNLIDAIKNTDDPIKVLIEGIQDFAEELKTRLHTGLTNSITNISDFINEFKLNFYSGFNIVKNKLTVFINDFKLNLSSGFNIVKNKLTVFINDFKLNFSSGFNTVKNKLTVFIKDIFSSITNATPGLLNKFGTWSSAAVKWLADAVPPMVNEVSLFVTNLIQEIDRNKSTLSNGLQVWVDKMVVWIEDVWPSLRVALRELFETFGTFLATNAPTIAEWVNKITFWIASEGLRLLSKALKQMLTDLGNYFKQKWIDAFAPGTRGEELVNSLKTALFNAWGDLTDFFSALIRDFETFGEDLVWGIVDGLENSWHNVTSAIRNGIDDIKGDFQDAFRFGSPSKVTMQYGEWIGEGFEKGIKNTMDNMSITDMLLTPQGIGDVNNQQQNNQYHLHLQTSNKAENENLEANFNTLAALGSL